MSAITTHVLDTARGRPAAGISVVLERRADDGRWDRRRPRPHRQRRPAAHAVSGERAAASRRLSADLRHAAATSSRSTSTRSIRKSSSCSRRRPARRTTTCRCCSARSASPPIGAPDAGRSLSPRDLSAITRRPSRRQLIVLRAPIRANPSARQPVHTYYRRRATRLRRGLAADAPARLALAALNEFAPTARGVCAERSDCPHASGLAETVRARVVDKLKREPVEDLPSRLRGRLRHAARRRRRRPRAIGGASRVARRHDGRNAAAVHRHSHQAAVEGAARAQPAHARPLRDHARRRPASGACPTTSRSRFRRS